MAKKILPEIVDPRSLRVLMVEDSEDDALLIIRELKKGGYNPVYDRVETTAAMKKALKAKQWDIILCDYNLPKFSGLQAIAILKETNIDIPIIIVSGAIGEETAVECMRLGAQDYIMKNNLSRLGPAIARELKEAEIRNKHKQAENELKKAESRFRHIIEQSKDGIIFFDGKTRKIILGNTAMAELIGCPKEKLVGRTIPSIHPSKERKNVEQNFQKHLSGKLSVSTDIPVLRDDGSIFYADISSSSITLDGKAYFSAFFRNITERKRAEEALRESEEKYRNLVERANDGIGIAQDGILRYVNTKLAQTGGYSVEELTGKPFTDFFAPEEVPKVLDRYKQRMAGKKVAPIYETALRHKDGSRIDVEVNAGIITYEGKPADFVLVRDITERKKAEEALQASEEKYRTILETMEEGYYEVDLAGNTTFVNRALCRVRGYSREELIDRNNRQYTTPEVAKETYKIFHEVYETEVPIEGYTQEIIRKNGEKRFTELSIALRKDKYGKKVGFSGVIRDITERIKAESQREAALAALRESEENFRRSLDNSPLGVRIATEEGDTLYANQAALDIYDYESIEELRKTPLKERYTPESYAEFQIRKEKRGRGEPGPAEYEINILRKNGEIRQVQVYRKDIIWNGAKHYQVIYRDITEQKRAEKGLQESEKQFKTLFMSMSEGFYLSEIIYDDNGNPCDYRYLEVNPRFEQIMGLSRDRIVGKRYKELVPNDTTQWLDNYCKVARTGEPNNYEFYSNEYHLYFETYSYKSTKGQITVFVRDITDRKRAESQKLEALAALKESEEKYRTILETMEEGYYEVDLAGNTIFVNDAMCRIQGYSREELIGINNRQYTNPETAKEVYRTFKEVYKTDITGKTYEHEIIKKDGTKKYIEASISLLKDASGKKIGFKGIVHDITERKRAEEELYKKHEELQTIIESSPIMIYFKDTENRFLRVNKAVLEASGLAKEEMEGKTNEEINPKMAATLWEEDKKIIATGQPLIGNIETIKTRKGSKILQTDKVPYRDKEGNIIGIVGFSVDITEQNKAQEELLRSEEKYRGLIENSQEGIYQSTADGRHLTINPAFARMLGYDSPEEVMSTITDIAHQLYVNPADRENLIKLVNKEGSVTDFETEFYKKDGSHVWVSINMHAVRDDEGRLLYYQGIDQDITEKKKIEEERQENIERLRKSLDATINAMAVTVETRDPYTAGHQRRVADLARAIAVEMNLTSEQIDGVRMASMIHDIGKISIPSEILTKPTQLTNLEFNLIKTHPASGYNILKDIEFPWPIARIVQEHHERIDGSGYPNGLKGEQILLESKIIAVADVVEAISSHRPYRAAFGIEVGLDEISKNKGILYEPDIVDTCLRLFREKNYTLAM